VTPISGEVLERLAVPHGKIVSGLESNGEDLLFCGSGTSGKVRAVWRPRRRSPEGIRPAATRAKRGVLPRVGATRTQRRRAMRPGVVLTAPRPDYVGG
jgi:hypothetical protein